MIFVFACYALNSMLQMLDELNVKHNKLMVDFEEAIQKVHGDIE